MSQSIVSIDTITKGKIVTFQWRNLTNTVGYSHGQIACASGEATLSIALLVVLLTKVYNLSLITRKNKIKKPKSKTVFKISGLYFQKWQCHNYNTRLGICFRLKETKETWQLNVMHDPRFTFFFWTTKNITETNAEI